MKSELQTTSVNVVRTQVLRDSSQKRNNKNNACTVPHKQTIDRIFSSKHVTVASHGSKKEMHSTFTTPRTFASVNGKQAVASISASARYDAKNILSSSSLSSMNINSKVWFFVAVDSSFHCSHPGFFLLNVVPSARI